MSRKVYVVLQQGGSSAEMYVHVHDSLHDANADRKECEKGAYKTSEPIEVPADVAKLLNENPDVDVWSFVEDIVQAAVGLRW